MLLGATARLDAASYYVSPSGTASWPACTNIATPCSAVTAFASAVAGDTVYFRGGTYTQTVQYADDSVGVPTPAYAPAHSGTPDAWITFMGYPGEVPIINGYVPLTPDGSDFARYNGTYPSNGTVCLSARHQSYIIFDGFTYYANGGDRLGVGKVSSWGGDHIIFRNLTSRGGALLPYLRTTSSYDNTESVRIEASSHVTVTNSRFDGPRVQFDDRTVINGVTVSPANIENYNVAAIKLYGNNFVTLDHLEIENATTAIFPKSHHNNDITITNNFIHDSFRGILVMFMISNDYASSDRGLIANNVIANIAYGGTLISFDNSNSDVHGDDWTIANNTLYCSSLKNAATGFSHAEAGHGLKYYNNIVHVNTAYVYGLLTGQYVDPSKGIAPRLAAEDHNQWGPNRVGFEIGRNGLSAYRTRYSTIAAWQASTSLDGGGHPGAGDLASDPQFANVSGTLKEVADFALKLTSPCKGAGRNGADMGADVANVGYRDPAQAVPRPGTPIVKMP